MRVLLATLAAVAAASAAAAAPLPGYGGCTAQVKVRPVEIVFACGDANFYANHLRWSRWTAGEAVATGTGWQNDCTPYCAAGHFHHFPIRVTLSKPLRCGGGRVEFSSVAWRFTREKPAAAPRAGSQVFSCRFRRERP
jgi:hypothetical protein